VAESAAVPGADGADVATSTRAATLIEGVAARGAYEAFELLEPEPAAVVIGVLRGISPALADQILWQFPEARRLEILAAAPAGVREQWLRNHAFPDDSIGKLMDPLTAVFRPEQTVQEAINALERIVRRTLVTYAWITDDGGRLVGVIVFRDLLFARREQALREIMVANPFFLRADAQVMDAMKEAVKRHFPAYPVCDADGRLMGVVRGQNLFDRHAFELSAQAGSMVGVEKEERLTTPLLRSLKLRHPWLQLNLLTAFIAAAVVGAFEATIEQLVVLAVFLPVLAGQSGNTGCQALAVVLRGITLGEMDASRARTAVAKEALLGLANGALVGLTAGAAMWVYARGQPDTPALLLALVVLLAMMGACVISGVSGAIVPMVLKRLGADPATASSIFLTTATDVASMGMFLGLASLLVL
jgi:magnesium transporter